MKTFFTSKELPHIWAHQSAEQGRCPGNLSFSGPEIRSYATGMARHIERNGNKAIIFNEASYSVTTSKAQSMILRAIPSGVPVFRIDGIGRGSTLFDITGADLFDYAIRRAAEFEAKARRARTGRNKDWLSGLASDYLKQAEAVNTFFGLRRKVDSKAIARLSAAKVRAEKKAKKDREAREARRRADNAEKHAAWLRGENVGWYDASIYPVAFRVEDTLHNAADGPRTTQELVSTLGARVPLEAARVALRFIKRHRATGWHKNGDTCPIGHYQLDAINPQGIVAGCHRVTWAEVERVEALIG